MSKQIKADLSLLAMTIIWGSSFVLMRNVLEYIPAFAYLSLRFIIATLVLLLLYPKKIKILNFKAVFQGCLLGALLAGGMALQVTGLYYTTASNSAFITAMSVVFVPIISSYTLKKKPDSYAIFGVIFASVGLYFITGGLTFNFNKGDFITLLSALCFSFQIILIDKFTQKQDPILLSILQIAFASIAYTVIWLGVDYQPVVLNNTIVYTLLITGVLCTAIAFTVQAIAQKHTTPTHTVLIFTAEPVFGLIFAMLIPNALGITEKLTLNTVIGCVFILLGMLLSEARPFLLRRRI